MSLEEETLGAQMIFKNSSLWLICFLLLAACGPQNFASTITESGDPSNANLVQEATPSNQRLALKEVLYKNSLSPTIYYHPLIEDDGRVCGGKSPVPLRGANGVVHLRVCPATHSKCRLEGSCQILRENVIYSFNYVNSSPGYAVFMDISGDECSFGFGVQNICLDPFYTVAADLSYHKPGDVIFVPKVKGTVLPSGTLHTGYFVVRDRGGAIKGPHRFDFFTGSYEFRDSSNPFSRLGLGNKNSRFEYYKLKPPAAQTVQKQRNYPDLLPPNKLEF